MWTDFVFYIVLLSQVILISLYYPTKLIKRTTYVLENYPPTDYPKLYANERYAKPEIVIRQMLRGYKMLNWGIGALGLSILITMAVTGYAPHEIKENEHILFVLAFAILQMTPYFYLEIATWRWHALVRATAHQSKRSAELRPRKLFDFASPVSVGIAVALLLGWFLFYVTIHNDGTPWRWNQYVTMLVIPIHLLCAYNVFKTIKGKNLNPHQATQDRLRNIQAIVQVNIFASIGMSTFMIIMELVNIYRLDMYEPLFLSGYIQFMVIFGIGQLLRTYQIKSIDFDVYKAEAV